MRFIVILFFLLHPIITEAQTTFSLSYSFGSFKPNTDEFKTFQNEFKKLKLTEIDSIHFVGHSDSVGTFLSNFRTAEYRARKLEKILVRKIKRKVPYAIYPAAGKMPKEVGSTRQIQIVIFSSSFLKLNKAVGEIPNGCFKVAYSELQNYHQNYTSRGRTSCIQIERSSSKTSMNRPVFYSGRINEGGNFEVVPLKWKSEKTGEFWWAKEGEVTEVPVADFDRFKIFTIEKDPCSDCNEDFFKIQKIQNSHLILAKDRIVMENIQFRTPYFFNNSVQIRVPKDFVDLSKEYFQQSSEDRQILWKEKDKDFYSAKVKQFNGKVESIQRKFPSNAKIDCQDKIAHQNEPTVICSPSYGKILAYNFFEVGSHFQNNTKMPYASIGLFTGTRHLELEFLAGIHSKSALYGAIRGRYNIATIPFQAIFSGNKWRQSFSKNRFWYTKIYVGTEYKASIGKRSQNYLEPNIHLGMTFSQNNGSVFHRLFIQYGYAVNFVEESPRKSYDLFQIGFQLQLGKKTYEAEKGNF